jgi:hypothetical protein
VQDSLQHHWNLELRVHDGYGNVKRCDLLEVVKLDFAIQTRSPGNDWRLPKRVSLKYSMEKPPDKLKKYVLLAIGNTPHREDGQRQQHPMVNDEGDEDDEDEGILEKLNPVSRLSLPFKDIFLKGVLKNKKFQKGWRRDQAQLLKGLVNWMLLLWNTDWTLSLCCCRIHFENLSNSEIRYVLIPEIQHDCRPS